MRARGASTSTRAKHLRVLGACLQAALRHRYASVNPVRELHPGLKPRPERKEAAYLENHELPRVFAELEEGPYRVVCLVALKTGMRQGELLGLCWGDVDLQEAVIRVRRTYTGGTLGTPKNHERRDVDLTSDVVELLGWWWGECGRPAEADTLVFPGTSKSGYLSSSALLNAQLYPALERGGIARIGPTGERRTFHSFRHTCRFAQEPQSPPLRKASMTFPQPDRRLATNALHHSTPPPYRSTTSRRTCLSAHRRSVGGRSRCAPRSREGVRVSV
jgi:integrase